MAVCAASGTERSPDRRLRRERRLRRASEFEEAYRGRKLVGRHMVMFVREAPDAELRVGVVTGRRIGGAVQRNRWRRRLREGGASKQQQAGEQMAARQRRQAAVHGVCPEAEGRAAVPEGQAAGPRLSHAGLPRPLRLRG